MAYCFRSQLRGVSNELKRWIKGWSCSELTRFGATNKLEWSFIVADVQHQNGVAESLVKVAKGVIKSMMKSIGTAVLTLILSMNAQLVCVPMLKLILISSL